MPAKIGAAEEDGFLKDGVGDNVLRVRSAPISSNRGRALTQSTTARCLEKAHNKPVSELQQERVDANVDIFIKSKLKAWDKDRTGKFNMEEVEAAMQELRVAQKDLATLKWQIIFLFVGIFVLVVLVLCAAGVAVAVTRQINVSNDGAFVAKNHGSTQVVVTTSATDQLTLANTLSFNNVTDDWQLSDALLRELSTISFETANGTFYSMQVTELARFDSGPTGDADTLDIRVDGNHYIRYWESIGTLEVLWANTTMWDALPTAVRRLEDYDDDDADDADDNGEILDEPLLSSSPKPPKRLLAKGGFGGFGGGMAGGSSSTRSSQGYSGTSNAGWGGSTYAGFDVNTRHAGRGYRGAAQVGGPSSAYGPILAVSVLLAFDKGT